RGQQDVRLDPLIFACPHHAAAPDPALHFVAHEQNAVAIAQLAQRLEVAGRRHDVASLTLNRLDEDRGDAVGRYFFGEQFVLDPGRAAHRTCRLAAAVLAAIAIPVRDVVDFGQERRESRALYRFARGQAHTT